MRRVTPLCIWMICAAAVGPALLAQTPPVPTVHAARERTYDVLHYRLNLEIDEKAKRASEKCGTPISGKLDVASFKGQDLFVHSPTAACRDSLNTVATICGTELGKTTVKSHVASVLCKKGDKGTKVSRDGSRLTVLIDPAKPGIVSKSGGTSWKTALDEAL